MTSLIFFGDFYPTLQHKAAAINGHLFCKIMTTVLKNVDFSFVNLESPILPSDVPAEPILKYASNLSQDLNCLNILKLLNNPVLCMANNHIMDYGPLGLRSTQKTLSEHSIETVGLGSLNDPNPFKPYLINQDNNKLAIFNVAEGEEGRAFFFQEIGPCIESHPALSASIARYAQSGHCPIVICHAGAEHIPQPPPHIVALYRSYVDCGAKLIIGHHPHVQQPYEVYNNCPIFYSLGNFLMYKKHWSSAAKNGSAVKVNITKNKLELVSHLLFQITENSIELINEDNVDPSGNQPINIFAVKQCWDSYCQTMSPIKRLKPIQLSLLSNYGISTILSNILTTPTHREAILNWVKLNEEQLKSEQSSLKNRFVTLYSRAKSFVSRKFSRKF